MRIALAFILLISASFGSVLLAVFPLFASRATPVASGPPAPDPLLLNSYSTAAAAYSVRRLDTNYAGNCLRIRRVSDDAEQDIGFSGDDIDTAAAESFCAATDGFVVTWYDQSGNANNAANATAASQPKIVASGTILSDGGNPILSFDQTSGTYKFLALGTPVTGSVNWTVLSVWARAASGHNMTPLLSTGSPLSPFVGTSVGYDMYVDSSVAYSQFNVYSLKAAMIAIALSGDQDLFINNSESTAAVSNSGHAAGSSFNNIGAASTFFTAGKIHELVIWSSDKSSSVSGISGDVNTYYSIY